VGDPGPAPVVGFGAGTGTPVGLGLAGTVAFDIYLIDDYVNFYRQLGIVLSWQRCPGIKQHGKGVQASNNTLVCSTTDVVACF
jgi:hypothetical protein